MEYFIIICVVAFLFVVLLVNFPKIKQALGNKSKKTKEPKQKTDHDTVPKKDNLSYDEKEFKQKLDENVVVDNLNRGDIKEQPFVNISESELEELEEKQESSGGRKYSNEQKVYDTESTLYSSTFEDDVDDLHDMYETTEQSELSEEIKHLSPELKAILISNILNKRDDI